MHFDNLSLDDVKDYESHLPNNHDFSKLFSYKIKNQKSIPNCSSHAWITCIEYLRQIDGFQYENFSVIYQYYMSRKISKCECELKGVYIEKSLENILINGVLKSSGNPIDNDTINIKPLDQEILDAQKRIINGIFSIQKLEINVSVFKYVLTQMYVPIVVVIEIDKDKLINKEPIIFKNNDKNELKLIHAVCIVGYDNNEEVFIFQNSYGSKWKYEGFGKIHYSFISSIKNAIALDRSCVKSGSSKNNIDNSDFCDLIKYLC